MGIAFKDKVRYKGAPSTLFQRGRDYTVGADPDGGAIYILEADAWANVNDFDLSRPDETPVEGVKTYTHDEYTFEWDGRVPVASQAFGTAEEAAKYVEAGKATSAPEHAARYGRVVHRTVTRTETEWEVVE